MSSWASHSFAQIVRVRWMSTKYKTASREWAVSTEKLSPMEIAKNSSPLLTLLSKRIWLSVRNLVRRRPPPEVWPDPNSNSCKQTKTLSTAAHFPFMGWGGVRGSGFLFWVGGFHSGREAGANDWRASRLRRNKEQSSVHWDYVLVVLSVSVPQGPSASRDSS